MIFFDVDGTLLNDDAAIRRAVTVFHQRFQSAIPEDLDAFCVRWKALLERWFDRFLAGELTMAGQRRGRMHELFPGIADEEADRRFEVFLGAYEFGVELYPDTLPALNALSGPLGIITNGQSEQQRFKLEQTGILSRFSTVVVSSEIGAAKPKREIFEVACRLAGSAPSESWYVGDRLETDALGARSAGMMGVWLCRDATKPVHPDVCTIRSLVELSGYLTGAA